MVQAIPEGVGSVVPYLCVRGGHKAIAFYKAAFGAETVSVMPMGDLIAHADLKIGASRLYLADEMPGWGAVKSPLQLKGTSVNVHLWVEDCDAVFAQAVSAGAKVVMPIADQFWGDRYGMVTDPFGHAWAISSHKEDLTPEEMARRGEEAMAQMAAQAPPKPKAAPSAGKAAKKAAKKAKKSPGSKATTPEPSSPKTKKSDAKKVKKAKKAQKGKKAKLEKKSKSKKDKKRKKKSKR